METKILTVYKGKLDFRGMWDLPIFITTSKGELVDISVIVYNFFKQNHNVEAVTVEERELLSFKIMKSNKVIKYTREFKGNDLKKFGISTESLDGISWTNTNAQLEYFFMGANNRNIVLELDESFRGELTLKVDKFDDDVPTVFYSSGNKAVLVGDQKPEEICKPGTTDCCIFLVASGNGFECVKFDGYTSRLLLDRYSKGKMNSTRIGNCKCAGRLSNS